MLNHTSHTRHADLMKECIANCLDCFEICTETVNYSIARGERYVEPLHLRLLMDCAEICQTSAGFMLRGSDLHPRLCELCARVCLDCAQSCDRFAMPAVGAGAPMSHHSGRAPDHLEQADDQFSLCSATCRRCADSCQKMANQAQSAG